MKLRMLLCGFAMGGITMLALGSGDEGDHKGHEHAQPQVSADDMQAAMEKWLKVAAPGPNHKHLDAFVGKWNTSTKMWWGGPGTPPNVSSGTSESKWVLDGRFILSEDKSEFMLPDPATGAMKNVPYTGMGMTGYDNYRNLYVGNWADNMSTHMLSMSGTRDPSGKVFTMYGQMDEPMLDMSGRMVKYVNRIINNDKHIFEIYDLAAGDNYKVIEITYTRQ